MEFTFLGTAAGEQYPGFWCHCENCKMARELGGNNIRKNASAWLEPDILIDFPSEIFMQAERYSIDISKVKTLFITHSHEDHLFPYLFRWRHIPSKMGAYTEEKKRELSAPCFSGLPRLDIYCNKPAYSKIIKALDGIFDETAIRINLLKAYECYNLGQLDVIPVQANHPDDDGGYGFNYIIKKDGKTIFYGLDTGWFLPQTLEELKNHKFDLVVVEGTCGYGADNMNHMNFKHVKMAYEFFMENGLMTNKKGFYISHLSPHWSPVHDKTVQTMEGQGINVAYDGLKLRI